MGDTAVVRVRPETRKALEQARDQDEVKVIFEYVVAGWDRYHPWPGPEWMQGRYKTWDNYQNWLKESGSI